MHKRKTTVGSVIGMIVLGSLMIALLIYTATRTVHFLQMTFPTSMGYVAYLALAAFDGGIIGWTIFATTAAEGATQRGIAYLMIFVCTLGVILTTIADTTTISAQNGITKLDPYMATVGMWGSIAVIVLNVVAIIVIHLAAPHHVRKFELENVHDSIHQLTMQHIKDRAIEIAPRIAAEHADHWVRQTIQDVVGSLPASSQTQQLPTRTRIVEAVPMQAASKDQVLDPHEVKPAVDSEKKNIEKKPSLADRIWAFRDSIDAKLDTPRKEVELVSPVEEVEEIEEEEETIETGQWEPGDPLPDNYIDWTDSQWKEAKDKLDAFTYQKIFDETFPDQPIEEPKKKGKGGRKPKNVQASRGE